MVIPFGDIKRYNTSIMETKTINNTKFYNLRKLEVAKRVGGEDFEAVLAEYDKLGGKFEVKEAKNPVAKKTTKRVAKKTKK